MAPGQRAPAAPWAERITAALANALEQSADGAAAASECLSDDQLLGLGLGQLDAERARNADYHLAECATCSALLIEAMRASDGAGEPRSTDGALLVFQPGMLVARRYRIVRLLGRGGMGEVYEAFDQWLEHPVALKTVLVTECDNAQAMQRLTHEAQISRRNTHPNLCRVFDVGVHGDWAAPDQSLLFLTLELIDGETLGSRLRQCGPLNAAEAEATLRGALSGLGALHASGIVHRDIKSDNVMLRGGLPSLRATVIDLGLARRLGTGGSAARRGPSLLEGSVSYMAPEQLLDQPVGPPADIFAIGIVALEMLTGRLPRQRPGLPPKRHGTLGLAHAAGLAPELGARFGAFIERCTSRLPERRYADARAALEDLDAQTGASPRMMLGIIPH